MIGNVHLHKQDCVIFFLKFRFFPFASPSVKKKNKKKELFHILWMRNCVLSCLRGLQWYWAFMNSFDIRAERYEFQHKFFSPWHYYWKLLSVHCDKKLIIILDTWWIAFIKVLFFSLGSFFVYVCTPVKFSKEGSIFWREKKTTNQATTTYSMEYSWITAIHEKVRSEVTILLPYSFFSLNTRKMYIHTS